jgi:HKD family nuclease
MNHEIITNKGIRNFGQELEEHMLYCNNFEIATAFITDEALKLIEIFLYKNKNANRIGKLITGFYHCFNSQKVLLKLQDLAKISRGRLSVKISRNERFHWKYYGFEYANRNFVYLGSANFTKSGMTSVGEILVKQTLNKSDKSIYLKYSSEFAKEWHHAIPISEVPLEKYKQNKGAQNNGSLLNIEIKKMLVAPVVRISKSKAKGNARVVLINDYLSHKTIKIISSQKSDWDKKNYNYFCYSNQTHYNATLNCEHLVIIEKYARVYKIAIANKVDYCTIKTTDGTYFIAYKYKTKLKKETLGLRKVLEDMGLDYHSKGFVDKSLGTKKTATLLKLLK